MYKSLHKRGDLVEEEDAKKLNNGKAIKKKKWGLKYEGKTIPGNHTKYIIVCFDYFFIELHNALPERRMSSSTDLAIVRESFSSVNVQTQGGCSR